MNRLTLRIEIEDCPLTTPFHITGYSWTSVEALVVHLEDGDFIGRGEAEGVYYKGETAASMAAQLEGFRAVIEAGLNRGAARLLLPPGGARNALDCALWDLESKKTGRPAWQIAGLDEPRPLRTTFTCGADTPERMAQAAEAHQQARVIKIKLTGESQDAERVCAIREIRPDVLLYVDANQGFTLSTLEALMPTLVSAKVGLIEQPVRVGSEALLDGFSSPIPIAADESVQSLADIPTLAGRFSVVNIKLDKCGGLTEGLEMARAIRAAGLEPMVGCMVGTSLAMAPGFILGQLCNVVDLDGPTSLKSDREHPAQFSGGYINCPEDLWGYP